MKKFSAVLFLLVSLCFLAFFAHRYFALAYEPEPRVSPTLHGDPNHPAAASGWVDTKLYFGVGASDAPDKSTRDAAWQDFLDTEVTPRFPSGLSVLDVYGQWQRKPGSAPIRVRTKLLVIDYPETPENEAKIEAIRLAWKQKTGDQSVLKVTQPAEVSF